MPPLAAVVLAVTVQTAWAGGLCSWTSDESTKGLPSGWRDGLRSLHDLAGCEGYNKAARPIAGSVAELLQALDLEDDGTDQAVDRQRLKRSYRELSVKHHPDKSSESSGFQRLRHAYEILDDPVKLLLYDSGGLELVRQYETHPDEVPTTENLEVSHSISLEEAYAGGDYALGLSKQILCLSCRHQPRLPRCRRCQACPDEVHLRQVWINQWEYYMEEMLVPSRERCRQTDMSLNMTIERGAMSGDRLRFESMAAQLPGHVPGDVLVNLDVRKHPVFKRRGSDLVLPLPISLLEALVGFKREVGHLDGRVLHISVPRGAVVHPESVLEIEAAGMPVHEDPSTFGRLFVQFQIEFPEHVDPATAAQLEEAFAL
ncbi:DnaJ protein-like 1 [Symbiodinium microadriaticum]|uniref:DnaJ protein-like 1 n=1 Tax=Symbiodinium microadriaticum TaxID=2951 RepID=A0A1Q9D3E5_SYMMI|nr:DnaJ protein-like 1 [Symbiodinium microadriaticum]